jgi:hypothetical protein
VKNLFKHLILRRRYAGRRCHGRHQRWRGSSRHNVADGAGIAQQAERLLGFVESFMTFTPDQQSAWTALSNIVREHSRHLQQLNNHGQPAEDSENQSVNPISAPARLIRMEQTMSALLAALQQIRPAFEQFYATLDEKQQRAFDELGQGRCH